MTDQRNVISGPLEPCSFAPLTGWHRDGCCTASDGDHGRHHICAVMTEEFLNFSASVGNDLATPRPDLGFQGLVPGDRWCLCASRWEEARAAGFAPPVILASTHVRALEITHLGYLQAHAEGGSGG